MTQTTTQALDQKTIDIVKSTVPVLEEHGEAITRRFYEMMFSNHPELLNIFNEANQKQGKQQRALANSIYAAAKYIDNLGAIYPVVKQIGHKHRSLNIKEEHYPIVGKHLLLAIKDVLGDAATEEIIEAWGKAYGAIADIFIRVEKELYHEVNQTKGGWEGFRPFIIDRKVKESEVITSFYLKPVDGGPIAAFTPGQYVTLKTQVVGAEYTQLRQYSLSDSPEKEYYRISIKREEGNPDGVISTFMHSDIQEGDLVELTAPAGDFVLDETSNLPVVLLSGGVGITPMLSMLNTLIDKDSDRAITFIHAAQNSHVHAMDQDVRTIESQHENVQYYVCYSDPTEEDRVGGKFDKEGFVTLEWLKEVLSTNEAEFYFCGPVPFMKAVNSALKEWGVPAERIHFEFFGPAESME